MKKLFLTLFVCNLFGSIFSQQTKETLLAELKTNMNAHLNIYYTNLNPTQLGNYFAEIQANPSQINQINTNYLGEAASAQLQIITANTLSNAQQLSGMGLDLNYVLSQSGGDDPNISDAAACRIRCGAQAAMTTIGCAFIPPPFDAICMIGMYGILIDCLGQCTAMEDGGPGMPPGGFPAPYPASWNSYLPINH